MRTERRQRYAQANTLSRQIDLDGVLAEGTPRQQNLLGRILIPFLHQSEQTM